MESNDLHYYVGHFIINEPYFLTLSLIDLLFNY
jgi:hypothetical protein